MSAPPPRHARRPGQKFERNVRRVIGTSASIAVLAVATMAAMFGLGLVP